MPSALELAVLTILRPHFGAPRADDAEEEGDGSTCGPTRLATHFFAGKTPSRSNERLAAMFEECFFFSEGRAKVCFCTA